MLTNAEFEILLRTAGQPAVSIFMPADQPGQAARQDSVRLGNLVEAAVARLVDQGHPQAEAVELTQPARALVRDQDLWRSQEARGLAVFLSPGLFQVHRLPFTPEELVVAGRRFHLTPLLPMFEDAGTFFVLAATADEARLYRATRHGMEPVEDADLPMGVASVADQTEYEQTAHSNPMSGVRRGRSGAPSPVPADQNFGDSPEDLRKAEFLQYLNKLAAATKRCLAGNQAPLVLAAQPELAGNFKKQAEIRTLWPEHVDVNPKSVSEDELHRRAWELVQQKMTQDIGDALDHFNSLWCDGSGRASVVPAELVRAARWGKMDTLILAEGQHLWGRFDEAADKVETHGEPQSDDDDLLNLAAQQTLLNGGHVKIVPPAQLPEGARAAGILRY